MSAEISQADLSYKHKRWIGYVQPEGLVVTAAVLADAWIFPPRDLLDLQERLAELTKPARRLPSFRAFASEFLDWTDDLALFGDAVPKELTRLVDGQATAPSFVIRDPESGAPIALGLSVDGIDLDDRAKKGARVLLSPHQTLERLLWENDASIGIVENGRDVRLVYAPRGESVGHATFRLDDMLSAAAWTAGREILGALLMLLSARRFEGSEPEKRLPALLQKSREYQSTVSAALREQVLDALGALLRGFEEADARADGAVLAGLLAGKGLRDVYAGLVTVIMRLVFLLYAEEKGLLPLHDPLYAQAYSLRGLFDRLERDRDEHGATQKQRFGAWAHLVSLFRLLHGGVRAATGLTLPARRGDLFDPERYPFLEGRTLTRQTTDPLDVPRVSDATVREVLSSLALYKGERLLYRGLDVEHIGGVYEGLMGFDVLVTEGRSACLQPQHVVVDLDALAKMPGAERLRHLKAEAGIDLKDKAAAEVRGAADAEALFGALSRRISPRRPGFLPGGTLVLQPGQERRRTGSHYTPRALTRPIVETALRPIWERLGPEVTPQQILDLKICDPAMGSGAFLVEACRQLAGKLSEAWRRTGETLNLPPDEDALLHARRLVAQRCLYGVDKNPLAVDLARVSLWLETFASEHPFTFVDHALRCGDSLVGLSREQIFNLAFVPGKGASATEQARNQLYLAVTRAERLRAQIHALGDPPDNDELDRLWQDANQALQRVRTIGDAMVASYFEGESDKDRKKGLEELRTRAVGWLQDQQRRDEEDERIAKGERTLDERTEAEKERSREIAHEMRRLVDGLREVGAHPVTPFHWEIEFPEVFSRENGGFDCFVGNPPFAGKNSVAASNRSYYCDWLKETNEGAHGNSDLVAYFFRRAFQYMQVGGTFGLIATNTISQGDTKATGLFWIRKNAGNIYSAQRRLAWPGAAAVVVSVVHVHKGRFFGRPQLDGKDVDVITSFLFHRGSDEAPGVLASNHGRSYGGSFILGIGFVFDDDSVKDGASSFAEMRALIGKDPRNAERIRKYLGGEDLNTSPTQDTSRYIIDFGEMSREEASRWPDLFEITERKVKFSRRNVPRRDRRETWWLHATRAPEVHKFLESHGQCLATAHVASHLTFCFVESGRVFSNTIVNILLETNGSFTLLQSVVHEAWVRFVGSSLEDRLRYAPTDCFETFPFPPPGDPRTLDTHHPALESIGKRYYDFRAELMIRHNEGLTKTYNHFHDPEDHRPDIVQLRALHAEMDRAVLDAYGWTDLRPAYDFRPQLDESTRYTWDDAARDEVLGRLLDLNRRYAAEEAAAKEAAAPPPKKQKPAAPSAKKPPRPPKKGDPGGQTNLF
ncbi:MAG: DNA methyltransferase [Polyangiaceae bacterium]